MRGKNENEFISTTEKKKVHEVVAKDSQPKAYRNDEGKKIKETIS